MKQRRPRTRLIKAIGLGVLSLGAAGTVCGVLLSYQVTTVRDELQGVIAAVPQLRAQIQDGELSEAQLTFSSMQSDARSARVTATGPLWKVSAGIPILGYNFRAVTEASVSADDVVSRAVGPLLKEYDSLDWAALSPTNGKIDVSQLQVAAPVITTAADTVRLSQERLASIETGSLIPEVADAVQAATSQLDEVGGALEMASAAGRLLPPMLGANGSRNYLLLIQNNAEARATGGIPGALAILTAEDGLLQLGEQSSASAIERFTPPLDVDPEQVGLYTARLGAQMQNVNLTPDFPTAAETAKRMWEERHPGQSIDGVLALDPVALAHLLEATGPIELTDPGVTALVAGTDLPTALTSENVVTTLLSDVYREIEEPDLQDVYFAAVASEIFRGFTSGQGDPSRLLNALSLSAEEQRLYLWSARESEQKVISQTALAGAVTGSRVGGAAFGMYFNDGTGAKMDYYADRTVELIQGCRADGYGEYTLRVSVTNNAPPDAHDSLPPYVTGGGAFGVEPGHIRTNYVAYGPAQSLVQAARLNDRLIPFASGLHGQRPVGTVSIELAPGESAELEFTFSKVVQDAEPKLSVTPTVDPVSEVVLPLRKESGCG